MATSRQRDALLYFMCAGINLIFLKLSPRDSSVFSIFAHIYFSLYFINGAIGVFQSITTKGSQVMYWSMGFCQWLAIPILVCTYNMAAFGTNLFSFVHLTPAMRALFDRWKSNKKDSGFNELSFGTAVGIITLGIAGAVSRSLITLALASGLALSKSVQTREYWQAHALIMMPVNMMAFCAFDEVIRMNVEEAAMELIEESQEPSMF